MCGTCTNTDIENWKSRNGLIGAVRDLQVLLHRYLCPRDILSSLRPVADLKRGWGRKAVDTVYPHLHPFVAHLSEKSKNSNTTNLCIVRSQGFLQGLNSKERLLMFKTEYTFLVTIFLSEWGYCVYIEIPLRISPAQTLRALKDVSYAHWWI